MSMRSGGFGGSMKGDLPSFIWLPLLCVAIIAVTTILLDANSQTNTFFAKQFNETTPHVNATFVGAYNLVDGQLYQFNYYLIFVFFGVFIATTLSTIFLNSNPISWLLSIFMYIPVYYINAIVSNIARAILTNPILVSSTANIPLPVLFAAYLPVITGIFLAIYIIAVAVRVVFFNPVAQSGGGVPVPR